jgi:lipid-A-disaccharide synthase
LLADKQVVPEFIQHEARADAIVEALQSLMKDASVRDKMISEFDAIVGQLGGSGASHRAAETILEEVSNGRSVDRTDDPKTAASSMSQ